MTVRFSGGARCRRGWLVAAIATAAVSGLAIAACGSGTAAGGGEGSAVSLPDPGGPAPLGTVALHLVDQSRNDPFAPTPQPRELMVQLWYPAESSDEHPAARYMEPKAAAEWEKGFKLPDGGLQDLRSHAHDTASVAETDSGAYPVVVYSPGSGSSRSFATALVEELVSRSYVVVTMDHTYDAAVVEFPDGRLVPAIEQDLPEGGLDLAKLDTLAEPERAARVADVRFVLDTLQGLQNGTNPDAEGKPLPSNLAGALDLSRIGILGHSLGGSIAAQVLLEDPRVQAAFAMDSAMPPPVRAAGLDRPIMLMRSDQPEEAAMTDTAWNELQARGWHRNLRLVKAGHLSFTDLSAFCAQLDNKCPDGMSAGLGSIDGDKAVDAQRAYTTAFFDQHLKGQNQPLLDGPSSQYPEVEFLP